MGIYHGHFSPMPDDFQPPRPGTMPKRAPMIPAPQPEPPPSIKRRRSIELHAGPPAGFDGRNTVRARKRGTAAMLAAKAKAP